MKYSVGKFNFCQLDKIFTESLNKCFMALFLIIVQLLKVAQFQKCHPKLYCKNCSNFIFCTVESGVQMARAWEQIMFDSRKIYYLKFSRTILRSQIHFEILLPSPYK